MLMSKEIMRKLFFLCLFISNHIYAQSVFTLNCVESSSSNNQFVINVDEAKKRVFIGNNNFTNVFISKEIIKFDTRAEKGFYTTEIIRSSGNFRVSFNSNYSFGGYCSKVGTNKF